MSIKHGTISQSAHDDLHRKEMKLNVQRAISRISIKSEESTSSMKSKPFIEEKKQVIKSEESIASMKSNPPFIEEKKPDITFEDILGLDKMQLEDYRYAEVKWKQEKEILWNRIVDIENTNRLLRQEKLELETTIQQLVNQHDIELEEIKQNIPVKQVEPLGMYQLKVIELKDSLIQNHTLRKNPDPKSVNNLIQQIQRSIKDIAKLEIVMDMLYYTYDSMQVGEPNNIPNNVNTLGIVYLITDKQVYQLQLHHEGEPVPSNIWYYNRIWLQPERDCPYGSFSYGTFYKFVPFALISPDVDWNKVDTYSLFFNGNIGYIKEQYHTFDVYPHEKKSGIKTIEKMLSKLLEYYFLHISGECYEDLKSAHEK